MPLVILALAIGILFLLIVKFKLNSFISLIFVSIFVAFSLGIPVENIVPTITKGLGGTLGGLAIVISFGAMLGKLMADSGGAQRIATTLINCFGVKHINWAVSITGFIIGIALFYEIGFVLLIPLVFTIASEAKVNLLKLGIPMAASLSIAHGFLPPHPGPTAIAVIFNADLGTILIYGFIISIPALILAGPVYSRFAQNLQYENPEGLYNNKIFKEDEMPSFGVSIFTALIPVILMAISAIAKMTMHHGSHLYNIIVFIGSPDIALTISVAIAIYTFGIARNKSMKEIMESVETAVKTIGMILLVVAGGGVLKQVLIEAGLGAYIGGMIHDTNLSPLFLAWLIAAVIRTSVGSATVSALTAGGIVAPLIPITGASPELMVLAVGAGSVIFGLPNDPGFWFFKEFFGLDMKTTFKTWCVLETIISLCGLVGVLTLNAILF